MSGRPDLVIRNGLIVDGFGDDPFEADVAVRRGLIDEVGAVSREGFREINAAGAIVTPGFVDVHTHYDGQAVWSSRLLPSSLHGVTTVVAGNCGVGFAPCRVQDRELLISVMEGVEDIPEIVMTKGLSWQWETFPEFMSVVAAAPHDIDIGFYLPHSALRVFVMGIRGARREPASESDLAEMNLLTREALTAGAMGFSTSNVPIHRTGRGDLIPSFDAAESEYMAVAAAMREVGRGVFQMAVNFGGPEGAAPKIALMERISLASTRTVTFSLVQQDAHPQQWREILALVAAANARPGVKIRPQVFPRPIGILMGLNVTLNSFSLCPSYKNIAKLPMRARIATMRDLSFRERLLMEQPDASNFPLFAISRRFDQIYPFNAPNYEPSASTSIAAIARATGRQPEAVAYDEFLKDEGNALLFAALNNYAEHTLDPTFEMMSSPHTIVGLGDGGAHYGLVCDAGYPTYILTHWVRDRAGSKLTLAAAIRSLSLDPARLVGLEDRGAIYPGLKADLNVIDFSRLALELPTVRHDLPQQTRRIHQEARGYRATIVNGQLIINNDTFTGILPGRVLCQHAQREQQQCQVRNHDV